MKKVFMLLLTAASLAACTSNDKKVADSEKTITDAETSKADSAAQTNPPVTVDPNSTTIAWLDSTYIDLGKKPEGKEIDIVFRFKNTGTKQLVIQNVTAGCGCTIPEKPEQPFAPGEEGVIKAKFNGIGSGEQKKQVTVTTNTTPNTTHTLTFRTELVKK